MRTARLSPPCYEIRLTIPAREALERAGNSIDRPPSATGTPIVELRRPPRGRDRLVIVALIGSTDTAARMEDEPRWPGECDATTCVRGEWVPCPHPRCGRALVWYEAGYVAGYRICLRGHHAQLSPDGRSATRRRAGTDAGISPADHQK